MRANPERGLINLRNEVDRLFERFWEPDLIELPMTGEWMPRLDVSETQDAIVVRVEVPGIDPKDIQITLEEQLLTVKGEKRHVAEQKDERYYRAERTYGSFARTIRLPAFVDSKKVQATFKHGLLTIGLPKATTPSGTVIPIKAE